MSAIDKAKTALLEALDQLEQAEGELDGSADRVDLCVIYSMGRQEGEEWHEVGGWSSTHGPKWLHAAMLRRAADAQDDAARAQDDEVEEDDDDE